MQLISKCNKISRFLLCAMDLLSKFAWVVRLKDKKGVSIVNASQNILDRKENQTKYGLIKVVNFIILSLKSLWKTTLKCIQYSMK